MAYWHVSGVDLGTVYIGEREADARGVYKEWADRGERMTLSSSPNGLAKDARPVESSYPQGWAADDDE